MQLIVLKKLGTCSFFHDILYRLTFREKTVDGLRSMYYLTGKKSLITLINLLPFLTALQL